MKLYVKLNKCKFWLDQVILFGYMISKDEIFIDPKKIEAVVNSSRPTNIHEIHNFLGLPGYYRKFVEGVSSCYNRCPDKAIINIFYSIYLFIINNKILCSIIICV